MDIHTAHIQHEMAPLISVVVAPLVLSNYQIKA